ncbi:MAG: MarR family winged helix-turn-helix transcriptional regulator [Candidatus Dormibacteria bacterium]
MPTAAPASAVETANLLRPVLLHLNRHLRREIHSLGVTAGQVSLLAAIHGQPGIGVKELAQREGSSAPTVSAHLDRLEEAGMVARTRGSDDRRRVGLTVTAEGSRVLRTVRSRRTAWLAARIEQLAPEQRAALDTAVGALRALVEG